MSDVRPVCCSATFQLAGLCPYMGTPAIRIPPGAVRCAHLSVRLGWTVSEPIGYVQCVYRHSVVVVHLQCAVGMRKYAVTVDGCAKHWGRIFFEAVPPSKPPCHLETSTMNVIDFPGSHSPAESFSPDLSFTHQASLSTLVLKPSCSLQKDRRN